MRYWVLAATIGMVFGLGCGDDGGQPDVGTDAGLDVGGDASVEQCDGIVVADEPGVPCDGPCGEGLQCSRVQNDEEALCRQVCVPDTCESVCAEGQSCSPIEGTPGVGVCADPVVGARVAYETCGTVPGFCADDLRCTIGSATAETGVCLPPCVDDACAPMSGYDGTCAIVVPVDGEEIRYCTPTCETPGSAEECPGDMVCADRGLCIWE